MPFMDYINIEKTNFKKRKPYEQKLVKGYYGSSVDTNKSLFLRTIYLRWKHI